jgi:hypothetical protein
MLSIFMLIVVMLVLIMLNVIMLSVIVLIVTAPLLHLHLNLHRRNRDGEGLFVTDIGKCPALSKKIFIQQPTPTPTPTPTVTSQNFFYVGREARVFVIVRPFQPSLIFAYKARSLLPKGVLSCDVIIYR